MDQQCKGERLELDERNKIVLLFLKAAYHISYSHHQQIDINNTSTLWLSSQAQLLHYLGKAERYSENEWEAAPEQRLVKLDQALLIALFLEEQAHGESLQKNDPHYYQGRLFTFMLAVNYCYQDLGRLNDALNCMKPALAASDRFHQVQAHIQMANIHMKIVLALHDRSNEEQSHEMFFHALQAVTLAKDEGNVVLQCNAHVCHMKVLFACGDLNGARDLAMAILMKNKRSDYFFLNDGINNNHRQSAKKIVEQTELTCEGHSLFSI